MDLIKSYDDIEINVRRFGEGLKSSQDLQNRLSTFVVWSYPPTEDAVGPSKFIGYRGMTAEKYVQFSAMPGEMDGGRTEEWLGEKQWFRELVEGTREYLHVKRKVDELVQKFGKSAKTSARYRAPDRLGHKYRFYAHAPKFPEHDSLWPSRYREDVRYCSPMR